MDNIKFMIHTYPKRLWYVNEYLIPQLESQGISRDDIIVWNDENKLGNLKAFVSSCQYIKEALPRRGGCWHLQDDVILCHDFGERIKNINPKIVNEGFVSKTIMPEMKGIKAVGITSYKLSWLSFQCIYIPNHMLVRFYEWFIDSCIINGSYKKITSKNCLDDYLFWLFYGRNFKNIPINNIAPNLVNHIDYLLGGTTCSPDRIEARGDIALAYYWDDPIPNSLEDIGGIIHGKTEN